METGTVFAVIFTVILISALLVFGFNFIASLWEQHELQQMGQAVKDLQTTVNSWWITTGTGSVTTFDLQISESTTFCFVDRYDPSPNIQRGWDPNTIIQGMITEKTYNLWIYYQSGSKQIGKIINHLNASENFGNFCADNGAQLKLENIGMWVEVSIKE